VRRLLAGLSLAAVAGCESSPPAAAPVATQPVAVMAASPIGAVPSQPAPDEAPLPSISLGGKPVVPADDKSSAPLVSLTGALSPRMEVIAGLQPLQTLLGKWRGTTRKEVGDFKGVDEPDWIWDLRTERDQPALVMTTDHANYFKTARLTWLRDERQFRLTATDADGRNRVFEGDFSEPVEEFQEAGTKVQKKFKLLLTEKPGGTERWQLVLNQQNNDRYLLELSKARANSFLRFDTVGHQREGTSFAKNDEDYGEKKCIISEGLGTMALTYKGKTYWVCCTGCKAAFEEDPESWIRDAEKKKAMKK
jgi:hypothetical protein